ncbi:LytR C-terminal domain-containing protein [Candidatus Gottesmanbacteria bacterium]|nr:LytR C-terminal domain-containing protein [Candidatus Gottesmanbacteria bacterium]
MAAKKQPVAQESTKAEPKESKKEERRPSMMQVVEVVDENDTPVESKSKIPAKIDDSDDSFDSETKEVLEEKSESKKEVKDVKASGSWSDEKLSEEVPRKNNDTVMAELFGNKDAAFGGEITSHTRKNPVMYVMWVIAGIAAAVLVGGSFFAFAKKSTKTVSFVPSPTVAPEPTATPTPEPVNKLDFTIKVFNGGGLKGAAGKMKKALEDKGYKVTETGNTSDFNHPKTEIYVKTGKENLLSSLVSDLKDSYALGTSAATLEASASTDAQVIVGKE